jgi:hypothetical protein
MATKKGHEEVQCLDLFALRILSLIVCRGLQSAKASLLVSIANETYLTDQQATPGVNCQNPRLIRAIRLIVRFSTTFPLMFLRAHHDHEVFKMIIETPDENEG